jgi:F0F1-type ATP synthase assembly protein I
VADFRPGDAPKSGGGIAGAGLQFGVAVILFLFLGQWLDKKFGTSPIFLFVCVFVGAGAALYSMYRKLNAINAAEDEMRKKNK